MRLLKNEISVNQGETFTLDFSVVNPDGSPYVLHEALENPHILVTVTSSLHSTNDRYVLNLWLDLLRYPKFKNVVAKEVESLPSQITDDVVGTLYSYTDGGTKFYKYYDTASTKFVDYELRFRINFSTDLTKEWSGQKYQYGIKLVTGERNLDTLSNVALSKIMNEEVLLPPTNLYVKSNQNNYGGTQWT